ncbi:hypothetical protein BD779DRAFT_1676953 [Infundibulicybe gibba]|nr:hypothetical protein BD779DRAFT_1676953 [Infundibulicybe gibba]
MADHGNADQRILTGVLHTARTTNLVLFIIITTGTAKFAGDAEGEVEGALCNVALTPLTLMGVCAVDSVWLLTNFILFEITGWTLLRKKLNPNRLTLNPNLLVTCQKK